MTARKSETARLDTRRYEPMDMSWRDQAACLGADTNAFFHSDHSRGSSRRGATSDARRICTGCPVRIACIADAVRMGDDQHGIRGGLDLTDTGDRQTARAMVANREEAGA